MERRGERCVARVRVVGRSREVPDEGVEGEDGGRAAGRAGRDVRGERGDATRDDDAERGRVGGPGDAPRDVRERGARDWTELFGDARVRRVGGRDLRRRVRQGGRGERRRARGREEDARECG